MGGTRASPLRRCCLQLEQLRQLFEHGLGFAGRAAVEAFGEAGVVAGEAVVGFADLARAGGEAREVGAEDELPLQMIVGAGALDPFEEQALRLVGRSIPQLEVRQRSGETSVVAIALLPRSLAGRRFESGRLLQPGPF